MLHRTFLALIVLVYIVLPSAGFPLVADISQHKIEVDTNFTGTELIVFGSMETEADLVIVITGPSSNVKINKKEKIFGIWINTEQHLIKPSPLLYFVRSEVPIAELSDQHHRKALKIGVDTLFENPEDPVITAFQNYQIKNGLYRSDSGINTVSGKLFHTVFQLPANIPTGRYTIEIMSIHDHALVALQSVPLLITRTGLEAYIYNVHKHQPLAYALVCVLSAILIGFAYKLLSN